MEQNLVMLSYTGALDLSVFDIIYLECGIISNIRAITLDLSVFDNLPRMWDHLQHQSYHKQITDPIPIFSTSASFSICANTDATNKKQNQKSKHANIKKNQRKKVSSRFRLIRNMLKMIAKLEFSISVP